jgi:hypothetical protein
MMILSGLYCLFWGAPEGQQRQCSIGAVHKCYKVLGQGF